jgi:hypothetical protein
MVLTHWMTWRIVPRKSETGQTKYYAGLVRFPLIGRWRLKSRDDDFWGDISKTNAHNSYASGNHPPVFWCVDRMRRQTMIRRFFVFLLLSTIVIGGSAFVRPLQSASPGPCTQDHAAWLTQVLERMETIKPGMTRWDLLRVFRTEGARQTFTMGGATGGASTVLRETFVSQDCPYFKIVVEFQPTFGVPNRDVIVKVSKPYVQFSDAN